jgi:hypothetical protein
MMKRLKKKRVKLPDPVHRQILVVCKDKSLGVKVKQLSSGIVIIKSFHPMKNGDLGPVEENGECEIGDALLTVSEESIEFLSYKALLSKIKNAPRPMTLRFAKWDYEEDEEEEEDDTAGSGEATSKATAAAKNITIYTSKDVPSAIPIFYKRRRFFFGAIICLMVLSWFVGYHNTTGSTSNLGRNNLQSMMTKYIRIRGHDNKNHTVKVLSHDDDGTITLDYNDLADKDLTGVRQSQKDIKGVRKRRHKREHEAKKQKLKKEGGKEEEEEEEEEEEAIVEKSPTGIANDNNNNNDNNDTINSNNATGV